MKRKDMTELERLLNLYFDEVNFNESGFTNKNQIAILLKTRLSGLGRWRNLPRGNGYVKWKPEKETSHKEFLRRFQFKVENGKKPEVEPKEESVEKPPFDDCPF